MIPRYTPKEVRGFWTDRTKLKYWLKVELAALWARMKLDEISAECYKAICRHAGFTLKRIGELEAISDHDLAAFVDCVRETLCQKGVKRQRAEEVHKRLTSYDTEDPALMLMLIKVGRLIVEALQKLEDALLVKAQEYKWTLVTARTHGQAAEPTTFGKELLVFAYAVRRAKERLEWSIEHDLRYGKMSGAVGTYAGMNPELETLACQRLGLKPALVSTQILQRDRHAAFLANLVIATSTIEQIARTFWVRMRFEVMELQEPRRPKQKGSSAMPHKKNPILTERLIGLARVMRGYLQTALENIATHEDREISQSGPERIILPDATTLALYMTQKITSIVSRMKVFPERMRENLDMSQGTWAGQRVRYALVEVGVPDAVAYELVQRASFEAVSQRKPLAKVLWAMPLSESDQRRPGDIIHGAAYRNLFDPQSYIKDGVETIFERFFPEEVAKN
ncbi:MAG: adenylosuccinate lyase [Patescibacteria group bacterium]|nr:adenylosuccinate lyase [Patescibacteria group bacterium]MDD5120975.1 adenylosuccinate lyase [Patescibacteria group bacterium]MDD5396418.1 adenylosuccinate lyase [Patescibacteria group bacterium]